MTDQRAQYNEYAIGAGHPSEPDVVNRLALIEHNTDGTHKVITLTVADNGNYIGATITQNDVTNNPDAVKIVNAGTGRGLLIDQNGAGRAILIDHDDTGTTPSLDIDRDGNNVAAISGLWVNVANSGGGAAYAAIFEAGRVGIGLAAPSYRCEVASAGAYGDAGIVASNGGDLIGLGLYVTGASAQKWDLINIVSGGTDYFGIRDSTAGILPLQIVKATGDIIMLADLTVGDLATLKALRVGSTATDPGDGNAYIEGGLQVVGSFTVANYVQEFGAWASKSNNTVYQADTDGFVLAYADAQTEVLGYTDSSNPPTTLRVGNYGAVVAENWHNGITFPVRKGDYWKVTGATGGDAAAVYWLPKGTGM